jgi:vacuolar-type H+-ATPase subunit H
MSILDTVSKVREAEQKADRLLAEAREEERKTVADALRRREDIFREARRLAAEEVEFLRSQVEEEILSRVREIEKETIAEMERLRAVAADRAAEASHRATDIFLADHLRGK